MEELDKLLGVADELLGPNGCPWDREQTLNTLQPYLLEETHELIEAIDTLDSSKIMEELGDVFFTLVFIAKLSEKAFGFGLERAICQVREKLVRRHPHVFGDLKISTTDELYTNWENIKKQEGKKSPIAGIPPTLPALARAQKIIHKCKKKPPQKITGEDFATRLWDLIQEAEENGIDAESALRRHCRLYEEKFENE